MPIYRDILSNGALYSDSFPMEEIDGVVLEFRDGVVLEFRGKNVTRKEGDIVLAGVNPSGEEADECADENIVSGIDVEKQRIKDVKTKMQKYVVGLFQNDRFKELQFLQGDAAADEQLAIVKYWNDVPFAMFIKQGLADGKC
uniref:TCTP domain-containing protein n=1 Tax=Romanomermis culicivorax TaxID=13658 RepID=A0A915KKW7_ROMCU